jgi:hypothetical protein
MPTPDHTEDLGSEAYNDPYRYAAEFLDDATEHADEAPELIQRALVCAVLAVARELAAIGEVLAESHPDTRPRRPMTPRSANTATS